MGALAVEPAAAPVRVWPRLANPVRSSTVRVVIWALAYLAVLDLSYVAVFRTALYYALPPPMVGADRVMESVVMLVAVALALPRDWSRLSSQFVWALAMVGFVPQLTIYGVLPESRAFMWATTGFWVLVGLLLRWLPAPRLPRPPPIEAHGVRPVAYLYIGLLVGGGVVMWRFAGLDVIGKLIAAGPDLSGSYANRAAFVAAQLPLNGYYFHWLALIFNPAFFVYSLMRRRWWLAVLILVAQLLVASIVGMRSYFFALFFAAVIGWVASTRSPAMWMAGMLSAVTLAGTALYLVLGKSIVYLFFTGRFLLDAGRLNFLYYDFFSVHGPIPLAYLIKFYLHLPYPGHYPYATDPALLIGMVFFNQGSLAAVGGIVPDAFMNFGYAGLVIWAVALVLVSRILDAVSEGVAPALAMAVIAMPVLSFTDTYFVRVLFTTGLFLGVVVLYLLPRAQRRGAADAAAAAPAPVAAAQASI